jgi:DNA-binding GntR family transcriptional regulator
MSESKTDQLTADPIYEAIKGAIIAGELPPGEPLRQDEIAKNHGVSKIPVREALLRLEVDGLVLFRKNKGAIVRGLSTEEILNLMDIRVALECKAMELAVPLMVDTDVTAAKELLDTYSHETDYRTWSNLNTRFHQILYEPCGNASLLEMIDDVRSRMGPFVRTLVSETSGLERPHKEHIAILDAAAKGKTEQAVELLRKHIETTKKLMASRLRRRAGN